MKTLFGTDGIRGEAGKFPLDARTVSIIGFSLARHLITGTNSKPLIIIGRDTRESSGWIEDALIEGATAAGAECRSAGVITTPGVAFLTRKLSAQAGVVISASHNPYHDNGIKIFSPSGKKMDEKVERTIEDDIRNDLKPAGSAQDSPIRNSAADEEQLREQYLQFLLTEIAADLSLLKLRIVVDCANGASAKLAPTLFEKLGADVVAINCEPDGRNINLNCGSLHIESLQKKVLAEKASLGIAFDGDADRALFVDEQGQLVDGDGTLWVLANYLQSRSKLTDDVVVSTVMSNVGLEIALRERDIQMVRTDVGDKYVLDELLGRKASLGGEQSGHIILPELSLAGDGMLTALCLLRALMESGKSLGELTSGFVRYPQTLVNVRVREKVPFTEMPTVRSAVREVEEQLSQNGRLLLRYSGTEPLARVMIEGKVQNEIEEYARRIAETIKDEIGA
jgi:phosphoglucosamine mutase